jgi:hypothetical protein
MEFTIPIDYMNGRLFRDNNTTGPSLQLVQGTKINLMSETSRRYVWKTDLVMVKEKFLH